MFTDEKTGGSVAAGGATHRWSVLAVLGIAQLMVVLGATIVNVALPDAQADLGFGPEDRQWVITAYAVAFGSLLLLGGRAATRKSTNQARQRPTPLGAVSRTHRHRHPTSQR